MSKKVEESVMQLSRQPLRSSGIPWSMWSMSKSAGRTPSSSSISIRKAAWTWTIVKRAAWRSIPLIDAADPIEEPYILCVSSPGIDRPLKRPEDFARHLNEKVDVKLYEKRAGKKEWTVTLRGYD